MSGRRLLDAVALFNASRAIASKHYSVRRSQVQLYAKTSSLTKLLKPKVEARTHDAFGSAQSLSNTASQSSTDSRRSADSNIPSTGAMEGQSNKINTSQGLGQDHVSDKSQEYSITDSVPQHPLEVQQEKPKSHPLPDGTVPPDDSRLGWEKSNKDVVNQKSRGEPPKEPLGVPAPQLIEKSKPQFPSHSGVPVVSSDSNSLSGEDARKLQRQFESQIPSRPADGLTGKISDMHRRPGQSSPGFGVDQEQDVFYQPPGDASPVLSALPRLKVPKTVADKQEGDPHIPQKLNTDVFYSSIRVPNVDKTESTDSETTKEMMTSLFQSPRVARMLGKKRHHIPEDLESTNARSISTSRNLYANHEEQEDIRQLASDMAKDAQASRTVRNLLHATGLVGTADLTDSFWIVHRRHESSGYRCAT